MCTCVLMSTDCVRLCVCLCMNGVGVFSYVSVGGLRAQCETICPLE